MTEPLEKNLKIMKFVVGRKYEILKNYLMNIWLVFTDYEGC